MTSVRLYLVNQNIVKVVAEGHSGYAESGSDIVCSAISSLMESCALGLNEVLNLRANIKIDEKSGRMEIALPKQLNESDLRNSQILLRTLNLSLKKIEEDYSKYLEIKEIK